MATLEERFQKGQETRTRFGGGAISNGSVPASREVAPDLHRIAGEALFGSIWPRTALSQEHKEMSTLSTLTVLERENQLRQHVGVALNVGLSPQQVIEVMTHCSFYGGIPAGFNAMGIAKEVFDRRGVEFTPIQVYDPSEDPEALYQRGQARRRELMGDRPTPAGGGPVTNAEKEFVRLLGEYYWGSVWTRPGLDLPSRSLCTVSSLAALGRERQLKGHIRGALNVGFSQEQVVEIFVHIAFYAGLPAARTAIDVANEVFRQE